VVRSSDFVGSLDQEPLKFTGLAAERYTLKIDGEKVGDFTREQFAAGLNLALQETPMQKQAADVRDLTVRHNQLHYDRWRDVQVPFQDHPTAREKAAWRALDRLEEELVRQQRAVAQPKARHYELIPE
jgi:hypothetical protein